MIIINVFLQDIHFNVMCLAIAICPIKIKVVQNLDKRVMKIILNIKKLSVLTKHFKI